MVEISDSKAPVEGIEAASQHHSHHSPKTPLSAYSGFEQNITTGNIGCLSVVADSKDVGTRVIIMTEYLMLIVIAWVPSSAWVLKVVISVTQCGAICNVSVAGPAISSTVI